MIRRTRALVAVVTAVLAAALGLVATPAGAADPVGDDYRYVALGDSYTAAPLVPQLLVANGCFRSTNNYPHVVARALGVTDFADVSCSGADTADLYSSQLPGVGPQLDAVTAATDLVTVGIGGNDESVFGTLVGYCPTLRASDPDGAPCRDAMRAAGGDRLYDAVARTHQRVDAAVAAIRARAPEAEVVVVGYPQIAPRTGTCPDLLPLADGDVRYAVTVNQRLTQALKDAAAAHDADYADVWKASRGHDICSDDPWVNGQYTDPTRAQSFHPFADEQAAVAELVLAEVG